MHTVAVIVPNPKALQQLADSLGIKLEWSDLCRDQTLTNRVLKEVQAQGQAGMNE